MKRFAALALLTAISVATAGEGSERDPLAAFADKLVAAMVKDDWRAFRKMAAAGIAIEEHWNAYDDYFVEQKGRQGSLGWHAQILVEYRTVIENKPTIPKGHLQLFKAFCKQVRKGRDRLLNDPDWLFVHSSHGKYGVDSFDISTPNLLSTLASNVDLVIEVVPTSAGWRVQRLMLVGH